MYDLDYHDELDMQLLDDMKPSADTADRGPACRVDCITSCL